MSADDAKSDLEKMIDCSYICNWWAFVDKGIMSWANVILMLHGACMLMPTYLLIAPELTFLRELAEARRDLDEHLERIRQRLVENHQYFIWHPRSQGKSFLNQDYQQAIAARLRSDLEKFVEHSIINIDNKDQGGRK